VGNWFSVGWIGVKIFHLRCSKEEMELP
jgi:hypothetical protein